MPSLRASTPRFGALSSNDNEPQFSLDGMLVYGNPMNPDGKTVAVDSSKLTSVVSRLGSRNSSSLVGTQHEDSSSGNDAGDEDEDVLRGLPLRSRTVRIGSLKFGGARAKETEVLDITVWELKSPQELMEEWMYRQDGDGAEQQPGGNQEDLQQHEDEDLDPFGCVLWPGAQLVASRLLRGDPVGPLAGRSVLCLGAGTGLEALAAEALGAESVVATDTNPVPLALLRRGASATTGNGDGTKEDPAGGAPAMRLTTAFFDILNSSAALPDCDVLLAADCIYNKELAEGLARRCVEAACGDAGTVGEGGRRGRSGEDQASVLEGGRRGGASVLLADSQGFHRADFMAALSRYWPPEPPTSEQASIPRRGNPAVMTAHPDWWYPAPVAFEEVKMENVQGSGLLIEGDLEYNITVRLLFLPPLWPPPRRSS